MKSPKSLLSVVVALALFSQAGNAQDGSIAESTKAKIMEKLMSARSDLEYSDLVVSPIPGYYQVTVAGGTVLYVSEDASHLFAGELFYIEPDQFVNATEAARADERLAMLAAVDRDDMIIFPAVGAAKGVLTVFTDVTCAFCRKLHAQMAEMNAAGIEVHYLAYPRSGIERDGAPTHEYTETAKAWCADDRQATMTKLKAGELIEGEVCENNPVAMEYALGRAFGVTGTPAIVLPDGTLLPGYRPTEDFVALLGISQ